MGQISQVLLRHHQKITLLFEDFDENPNLDSFNRLNKQLERHFHIEENAIFSILGDVVFTWIDKLVNKYHHYTDNTVEQILREHKKLLELADDLKEQLRKTRTADETTMSVFRNMLGTHAFFEDNYFYPRLDKELDENKKRRIIEKLEEL